MAAPDRVVLSFMINEFQRTIIQSRESIYSGLAKIGGFFAIIRLLTFISFFHQSCYEKKAAKIIKEFEMTRLSSNGQADNERQVDFKQLMSLQNYYNMNLQIAEHEERYQDLSDVIKD